MANPLAGDKNWQFDMEFYLPEKVRMYTVRDDIVSTFIDAQSDNGAPNYEKKEVPLKNKPKAKKR